MRRTSQTIAMNLRFHLYVSTPGATYRTSLRTPTGQPATTQYSRQEIDANAKERDRVLVEWAEVDPEGYRAWHLATVAMQGGDESALAEGWSAMILEEHGLKIVDPCAYCQSCRR
jgi:hypothetical protein